MRAMEGTEPQRQPADLKPPKPRTRTDDGIRTLDAPPPPVTPAHLNQDEIAQSLPFHHLVVTQVRGYHSGRGARQVRVHGEDARHAELRRHWWAPCIQPAARSQICMALQNDSML